jgi:hypothetical protein
LTPPRTSDDEAQRIELPVDLGQEASATGQACRSSGETARSRRGRVQRQAAETAERQPVAHRLLGGGIGERVPLLQKNDLEHRQRRVARRSHRRAVDRRKQSLKRRPVEPLFDPVQKSPNFPIAAHHRIERRLGQVTARHRRIILSEPTSENQIRPLLQALSQWLLEDYKCGARRPRVDTISSDQILGTATAWVNRF